MRIAVIGAGVSGLTAALGLSFHHDVTLLEAADYIGGHTNTVDVEELGQAIPVDTGFIVLNDRTYPNFQRMLQILGIATRPTTMSFSVRCDRTGLEYRGADLRGLFAQKRNLVRPRFLKMLKEIPRFNQLASDRIEQLDETVTVREFLDECGFSESFARHYFLPMGAAIWSCPTGRFSEFPIRFILQFFKNHGLLALRNRPQWMTVRGGSQQYVAAMLEQFRGDVRLAAPVKSVCNRDDASIEVAGLGWRETFDHVVFACHSDQALTMLGETATAEERAVLGSFGWERNEAVLHTDTSLLPRRRRAWASWNYRLSPLEPTLESEGAQHHPLPGESDGSDHGEDRVTVTYNMNILQGLATRNVYCVTLNQTSAIDPDSIIARFNYDHPVFGPGLAAAQARRARISGVNRRSYCGAYWRNGFHEDGVVSALSVCRELGVDSFFPDLDRSTQGRPLRVSSDVEGSPV